MAMIKMVFMNGKILIFDKDEYFKIRSQHHLLGKLIGIPICQTRHSSLNALPACFNNYELNVLLRENNVIVADASSLKLQPNENIKRDFSVYCGKLLEQFKRPYIKKRLSQTKNNINSIVKGKVKKFNISGVTELGVNISLEQILLEQTVKISQSINIKNIYDHVPTKHPFEECLTQIAIIKTENSKTNCTFNDLNRRGLYVSDGDSFGADFLAYPGDPKIFHASHLVKCVDYSEERNTDSFISFARLSVSVNKKCVLAYCYNDKKVGYQTITWDNPRLRQAYTS
ncbi:CLUMA_CG000090, isoform A [Clunio marinus]|uniref:tRNA-intron lyase n=1 Tax=Clunio marinus TaxID=568069 RepID=A0A1J1HI59_9DIPT|nr:CLUMA_CG000090, isoform A [Clunio marinus]